MSDRVHGPVVVGIDGGEEAERAVRYGAWEAERRHVPLRLVYADVAIPEFGPLMVVVDEDPRWAPDQLDNAEKVAMADHPDLPVQRAIVPGSPAGVLVAESTRASLLVVGTHASGGLAGHLAGSVAAQVATHAHAPVVVLRGSAHGDPAELQRWPVVVGVDGSPESEQALGFAVEQAAARGSAVRAVYVWNTLDVHDYGIVTDGYVTAEAAAKAQRLLTEATSGWSDRYPEVTIICRALPGMNPAAELVRAAEDAGLVVVGSRGHGGFLGLRLGSTVDGLVRYAPVPVAVVRGAYEMPR